MSLNMYDAIAAFGDTFTRGVQVARPLTVPFRTVICCGMGGSSVAGELASMARSEVYVHWDYDLPAHASSQDLVICTSWSGQTAETLSSYDAARRQGIPVAAITTGGELARRAKADDVPLVLLPNTGIAPRCGAGFMTGALFAMLGMADRLPTVDAEALENEGKRLAEVIGDRLPFFYASYPLRKVAGWFKTAFNENAQRHASVANFPSAGHNELVGWAGPYRDTAVPVLIRGKDDAQYRNDLDAAVALWERMRYTVGVIALPGDTELQNAFSGYVLALWTGYHSALMHDVDPNSTALTDEFKELKKKKDEE